MESDRRIEIGTGPICHLGFGYLRLISDSMPMVPTNILRTEQVSESMKLLVHGSTSRTDLTTY